jgi:hypothetical protein
MRRLNGEYIKTISVSRSVTRRMPAVYMNSEAGSWDCIAMRNQESKSLNYLNKKDRRFDHVGVVRNKCRNGGPHLQLGWETRIWIKKKTTLTTSRDDE